MIEFPNGVFGLALNLEETEVGAILMGETTKVAEGDEVRTTGRLLQVPVGKALLGASLTLLVSRWMEKVQLRLTHFIHSKKLHQVSSNAAA